MKNINNLLPSDVDTYTRLSFMRNAAYVNEKGLGWRQIHMLGFARRTQAEANSAQQFHIANDAGERRVALSLQRRGLLRIVNNAYENWMVALP